MRAVATLHAAWWNTEDTETLKTLFTAEESLAMIRGMMGGTEVAAEYAATELTQAFGEKFGAYVTAAVKTRRVGLQGRNRRSQQGPVHVGPADRQHGLAAHPRGSRRLRMRGDRPPGVELRWRALL